MRANKPLILGITGGVGSGKSEAARYLSTLVNEAQGDHCHLHIDPAA